MSALLNYQDMSFSSVRLIPLLIRLGQDIDITVKSAPRNRARGRIRVLSDWRE